MTLRRLAVVFFVLATVSVALSLIDFGARAGARQLEIQARREAAAPSSPEQQRLAGLAGTWEASIEIPAQTGRPTRRATGQEVIEPCCGGRFWTVTLSVPEADFPYQGQGLLGFDVGRGKYVRAWGDAAVGSLIVADGNFDARHHALTLTAKLRDSSGEPVTRTYVETWPDPFHRHVDVFDKGELGLRTVVARIDYLRLD